MKVYFITRFSILDKKNDRWILAKLPFNEYKKKLFSKERLDSKFYVFEKMTLPSIINQTNKNYQWLIITSKHLPIIYKNKLIYLTNTYPQIKLFFANNYADFKNILKNYPFQNNYATVRLDDDDSLNENFVQLLQKYQKNKNAIISFPWGHKYKIETDKIIIDKNNIYIPKVALGLTAINMNIYNCGNHLSIDEKYKVIYDGTKNMYNLLCSDYCDTKRNF